MSMAISYEISCLICLLMGGSRGVQWFRGPHPLNITNGYRFPQKIWYGPPLEKQLDPLGPIAPRVRSVRLSVKYT